MDTQTFKFKKPSLGQAINGSLMMMLVFFIASGFIIKLLSNYLQDAYIIGGSFGLGAALGFQWSYWKYYLSTIDTMDVNADGVKFLKHEATLESLEEVIEDFPRAIHIRHKGALFHIHFQESSQEAFDQVMNSIRRFSRARQLQTEGQISNVDGVLGKARIPGIGKNEAKEMITLIFAWVFSIPILLFTILMTTLWSMVPLENFTSILMSRGVFAVAVAAFVTIVYQVLRQKKILPNSRMVPVLVGVLWIQSGLISTHCFLSHQYIATHKTEFEDQISKAQGRNVAESGPKKKYVLSNGKLHEVRFDNEGRGRLEAVIVPNQGQPKMDLGNPGN